MKERFTKEPVLAVPDIFQKMRMEVDALDYMTGGVLSIECEDRLWRPVAFLSKSLNKTERNYESMIRRCWQLFRDWRVGDIYWKECNLSLRSGQIIRIWNIL